MIPHLLQELHTGLRLFPIDHLSSSWQPSVPSPGLSGRRLPLPHSCYGMLNHGRQQFHCDTLVHHRNSIAKLVELAKNREVTASFFHSLPTTQVVLHSITDKNETIPPKEQQQHDDWVFFPWVIAPHQRGVLCRHRPFIMVSFSKPWTAAAAASTLVLLNATTNSLLFTC